MTIITLRVSKANILQAQTSPSLWVSSKKKQGVHYELTRQGEKREEDEMRGVERGTRRLCLLGIQERSDIDKDSSMVALRGGPERKKDFFLLPLSCMFATPVSHAVTNNSFAQEERRRREHAMNACRVHYRKRGGSGFCSERRKGLHRISKPHSSVFSSIKSCVDAECAFMWP